MNNENDCFIWLRKVAGKFGKLNCEPLFRSANDGKDRFLGNSSGPGPYPCENQTSFRWNPLYLFYNCENGWFKSNSSGPSPHLWSNHVRFVGNPSTMIANEWRVWWANFGHIFLFQDFVLHNQWFVINSSGPSPLPGRKYSKLPFNSKVALLFKRNSCGLSSHPWKNFAFFTLKHD